MENNKATVEQLEQFAKEIHKNAVAKGFWDEERPIEHFLMLVVCEVAEAVEADRQRRRAGKLMEPSYYLSDDQNGDLLFRKEFKGTVDEELADVAIRLLDINEKLELGGYNLLVTTPAGRFPWKDTTFTTLAFRLCDFITTHEKYVNERVHFSLEYVFRWAKEEGVDLLKAIEIKMAYNATRARLHGKSY